MIQPFDDKYFMQKAFEEALRARDREEVPVGAVVVARQRIIGKGHNLTEQLTDVTAHAEMQAITAASGYLGSKYLTDCTLYVTLEPCVMCAGALYWAQLGRVVFAAADPKRGYRLQLEGLHPKTQVENGLMAAESTELLQDFFRSRRQ